MAGEPKESLVQYGGAGERSRMRRRMSELPVSAVHEYWRRAFDACYLGRLLRRKVALPAGPHVRSANLMTGRSSGVSVNPDWFWKRVPESRDQR